MLATNVQPKPRQILEPIVALAMLAGLVILSVFMSGQSALGWDIEVARWVQGIDLPGLETGVDLINVLTSSQMAVALWLVAMILFALAGRPLEALAVFFISGVWLADQALGVLISRPGPPLEIVETMGIVKTATFPSGHVSGAVIFYGILSFLALSNLRSSRLRIAIPAAAITLVALTSIARVYSMAHWPTDILGSYLLGAIGIIAIAWGYLRVKEDRLSIPKPWARKKLPPKTEPGVLIAHSIGSIVYLDTIAGTATKQYHTPWVVRALYWLAFQAPFPYENRRDSLEAAAAKRKIAGLLTKHRFGRDIIAPVLGIRSEGGEHQFVTEFVPGGSPRSNSEIEETLSETYSFFREAGLPTWQIAPANPHAYSNFIRTPQGELKLIDLESSLVALSSPWRQLIPHIRDGHFPVFDDVDFVKLRRYVGEHCLELTESLGLTDFQHLNQAIEDAEVHTRTWKESEPRVWGRMARWIYGRLDFSGLIERSRAGLGKSEAMATAFMNGAIERWEREGRIDTQKAEELRNRLSMTDISSHAKHLGAHLVISVGLVIPIPGLRSLARFAWVVGFRLRARYALARGRITKDDYKRERDIHSTPVMIVSLIPAVGAGAYVVSNSFRKSGLARLLVDQMAYNLPFGLYRRLRLERLAAGKRPDKQVGLAEKGVSSIIRIDELRALEIERTTSPVQSNGAAVILASKNQGGLVSEEQEGKCA